MDVQQFVGQVLVQIMRGVEEAQRHYPPTGFAVDDNGKTCIGPAGHNTTPVRFDLSVEVVSRDGQEAGQLRVAVGTPLLGASFQRGGARGSRESTVANRVRFSVPVNLPNQPPTA